MTRASATDDCVRPLSLSGLPERISRAYGSDRSGGDASRAPGAEAVAASDYGADGDSYYDPALAKETHGLLSEGDRDGDAETGAGPAMTGVSPLNVYKMSRKEWFLAMWRAPTW